MIRLSGAVLEGLGSLSANAPMAPLIKCVFTQVDVTLNRYLVCLTSIKSLAGIPFYSFYTLLHDCIAFVCCVLLRFILLLVVHFSFSVIFSLRATMLINLNVCVCSKERTWTFFN